MTPTPQRHNEDAVSPVVGVILMLVVTIVIAAVIAAFATGTFDDSNPAPTAMLEVRNPSGESFDIVHTGGDPLLFKDIVIAINPLSNKDSGLIKIYKYGDSHLTIPGRTASETSVISAGDTIRVDIGDASSDNGAFPDYTPIMWKVSDARTTQILAEGEFIIPPSE